MPQLAMGPRRLPGRMGVRGRAILVTVVAVPLLVLTAGTTAASASAERPDGSWQLSSRTIYVESTAPATWRVRAATRDWSRTTVLRLRYGRCRPGYPCIRVTEIDHCSFPYWGVTSNQGPHSAVIQLNKCFGAYQGISCHELGHAFGLDHRLSRRSCMSVHRDVQENSAHPDRYDTSSIDALY